MSYGTDLADVFHQIGVYTGSILKGGKPADLPVLQTTKFEFVINRRIAKALGLEIPVMLSGAAAELIDFAYVSNLKQDSTNEYIWFESTLIANGPCGRRGIDVS